MGPLRRILVGAALTLALAGSAFAERVRDRVDIVESDIRALEQRLAESEELGRRLDAELRELRTVLGLEGGGQGRTPADLAARLDSVEAAQRVLQELQRETAQQLALVADKLDAVFRNQAALSERLQAGAAASVAPAEGTLAADGTASPPAPGAPADPGAELGGGATAAPGPTPIAPLMDPQELYQAARADYGRGSYQMAIAGFEEFLAAFPDSDLADNARYWIGESHFAASRYEEALEAFTAVVRQTPESEKLPDAEYKRGLCLLELGHQADGILQLQRVRDAHPDTAASRLARQKLQSLGLDPSSR